MPTWKMLLGILLACLCRLANLLPDDLPLVVLVLLDRTHQRCALHDFTVSTLGKGHLRSARAAYLVLGKLCVVHILVPVFLDTALGSRWEGLRNKDGQLWLVRVTRAEPGTQGHTLAISAQLEPESLICFRRSSSAGVHGVFVLLFLAGGAWAAGWALSTGVAGWVGAAIGAGGVGTGTGVAIWGGC